ncbi:electron transfer flavoprotein subunit beta/FixA family protein [Candidatus Synchoanobacter obligatus]|uniref:Electron transfer flavoprotein subunit beta n=1 Tax=Candidatus Synchoanobacter obligatus TaxID=2919597 RepID=A0ABT1L5E0_9GAMM|nr:electron transfer flavoprotein subunit beta/FixA family protein [Candidatus Synchoanobacter obligatus]MCP8352309.1 electron transfer flavoprotein subunit beta/FixA family protein [Candidatus Synchoanobacter obligatus]
MKVLVTTKSAIDYQVKVVIKSDFSGVETDGVQMSMNPFDAIAVEACVQLQEQNIIATSHVITIDEDDTVLRQALAMGIQEAFQIPVQCQDPYQKALLLAEHIKQQQYDMILMGKLGIDGDHSQIPPMLAGILDWPIISNASDITYDKVLEVKKETDQGIATLSTQLPCVVSCDLRLNTPRFIALPKLLQAKKSPINLVAPASIPENPHQRISMTPPKQREGNPPTDDLDTFIQQLTDGGILS